MIQSSNKPWLLTTCALLSIATAQAETTAQTDLASITVTPLTRQTQAKADWQTVYDYSGGDVLPPGTRLTTNGKWIDPLVRKDKSGVTFSFPDLPNEPQAAQFLEIGFADERPIANYPTRSTIRYTSYLNEAPNTGTWWVPFLLTSGDLNYRTFSGAIRGPDPANKTPWPIHLTGENTIVFSFDGGGNTSITLNDQDASTFLKNADTPVSQTLPPPGVMLLPGLAFRNILTQVPGNKGNWIAVNSFKVEQMRPPLDVSAVAAVDLTVPGSDPIRVTIEIVDDKNASQGYLLRDALVGPGKYRLYWDGINEKQSTMKNMAWIGAGSYTFHLTTSKTAASFAGDINNSTPKYNATSYGLSACTALALTPPGTVAIPEEKDAHYLAVDSRKFDATDSIQLLCIGYDARLGHWIGSDGSLISGHTGDPRMQYGRGITVTPPDPKDPTNPEKQFYFSSVAIGSGDNVVACGLPAGPQNPVSKTLTSPDWNRPSVAFQAFQIRLGRFPDLLGPQHYLFFRSDSNTPNRHADWIFRNIRFYEEGSPDPGPTVTFDPSKFTVRTQSDDKNPPAIPPGSLAVEDNGRSVHLKNAIPVNYPFEYTVTPHTIMAFDLDVIDQSVTGFYNGIGLYPSPFAANEDCLNSFNFLGQLEGDLRGGFYNPALGAYAYRTFAPNTLYTDSVGLPPVDAPFNMDTNLLWQPGFYGVKVSEDGKLLFACNNVDNRLEVRDISGDGSAIAKIPVDCPMFVTWAPDGAAGAPAGTRYIYVDSPKEGILRIPWHTAENTFGKPEPLTRASEFAYPRGITYDGVSKRLFVCDTFNYDRSKVANQIVVIDPKTGDVVSRFGKKGGVDPKTGGEIDEQVFTCPLNIEADSKGAFWINDYYTGEVRKYNFDSMSGKFKLERRVVGANETNLSHFYWMPGDPPTRVWTVGNFFVRNDADIDANGRFTNQRVTSATFQAGDQIRPYPHFTKVGSHLYGVFMNDGTSNFVSNDIFEQVGDGWVPRFRIGTHAGDVALSAGLLARPGQPPTELDKAVAASGDKSWANRCWSWSDLNGDGKIEYSAANPEFQIAFNSNIAFNDGIPASGCLRATDGAFVHTAAGGLVVIPPKLFNGKTLYSWDNAKMVPYVDPLPASDVLAQDGHFYILTINTGRHDMGETVINKIECLDESGKLLWTRDQSQFSLMNFQSLGDGMISIMDRGGWSTNGPVMIRTSDGDLVGQVYCRESGDCWSHGALRSNADTAYIGLVQAYKVTGLSTVKTATVTALLPAGGE